MVSLTTSGSRAWVTVRHPDNKTEFVVSLAGTVKKPADHTSLLDQFTVVNNYLNYKGYQYKLDLYIALLTATQQAEYIMSNTEPHAVAEIIIKPLLELIDINDIYDWLVNVYKLKAPDMLSVSFDKTTETDDRSWEAQTYLVEDYFQLSAFTVVIKLVLLPLFTVVNILSLTEQVPREYVILYILMYTELGDTPAMTKLKGFVENIIKLTSTPVTQGKMVSMLISSDELPNSILGLAIVHKLFFSTIIPLRAGDKTIVASLYWFINSKINTAGADGMVRSKEGDSASGGYNVGGSAETQESMIEASRIVGELSPGGIEEIHMALGDVPESYWSAGKIDFIMAMCGFTIDETMVKPGVTLLDAKLLSEGLALAKRIENNPHSGLKQQIPILATIFKRHIPAPALDVAMLSHITRLIAIGFAYLWAIDCKLLALFITSVNSVTDEEEISYSQNTNRKNIPVADRKRLSELYCSEKLTNMASALDSKTSIVEGWINKYATTISMNAWIPLANKKWVEEAGVELTKHLDTSNIRLELAKFLIISEENTLLYKRSRINGVQ